MKVETKEKKSDGSRQNSWLKDLSRWFGYTYTEISRAAAFPQTRTTPLQNLEQTDLIVKLLLHILTKKNGWVCLIA